MNKVTPRRKAASRRKRFILFASGAALGSALGIIVGSVLTFWFGDGTVRAVQRGMRRLGGDDSHPHFDLLAQ
jgi:integral membrane sensor domain MASE1